jgi:hypothetical protein
MVFHLASIREMVYRVTMSVVRVWFCETGARAI